MTSQMAEKYSALRFSYWRLQKHHISIRLGGSKIEDGILLVGVLPGINAEKGRELADNGVLVLKGN